MCLHIERTLYAFKIPGLYISLETVTGRAAYCINCACSYIQIVPELLVETSLSDTLEKMFLDGLHSDSEGYSAYEPVYDC